MNPEPAAERRPDVPGVNVRRQVAAASGFRGDEQTARECLDDPAPEVRLSAFTALIRLGAVVRSEIRRLLSDPSPLVRRGVCELAGRLPRTDFRRLLSDEDDSVLEAACFAVGEMGDRRAVPRLVVIAGQHADPLCRESAIAALGAIGHPAGKDAVLRALEDRPAIRRRAAVALAAFEGSDVEAALARCVNDRDWQVRQSAAEVAGIREPERR
jgi:HEAT repeat protein